MKLLWRLIIDEQKDPYLNMGIDEAVLNAVSSGRSRRTLRLYMWRPSAISIGRFQALDEVVNLEACNKRGVAVVRRITGGGSVFHDEKGEVTYSIAVEEDRLPSRDFIESFRFLAGGVVTALQSLGLPAAFAPINDVVVNGRKISGSAQVRRGGAVLQHGTVLLEMDRRLAFELLKVPRQKLNDKSLLKAEDRVTTIRDEGIKADFQTLYKALESGFAESLGAEFERGDLSESEALAAEAMSRDKFKAEGWLRSR